MPYGLIALVASVGLAGAYVFLTDASFWSKALVGAILIASLIWDYGLFLQIGLALCLSLYFTYTNSR